MGLFSRKTQEPSEPKLTDKHKRKYQYRICPQALGCLMLNIHCDHNVKHEGDYECHEDGICCRALTLAHARIHKTKCEDHEDYL